MATTGCPILNDTSTVCSSHGYCHGASCVCFFQYMGTTCEERISVLAQGKLYEGFQYGGLILYGVLVLTLFYSVVNIALKKNLRYGLCYHSRGKFARPSTHSQAHPYSRLRPDPQQLPLTCILSHCLVSLAEFSSDPLILTATTIPAYIIHNILFYMDNVLLIFGFYCLVRYWVKMLSQFDAAFRKALTWLDRLASIGFSALFVEMVLRVSLGSYGEGKQSGKILGISRVVVLAYYFTLAFVVVSLLWFIVVAGCRLRREMKNSPHPNSMIKPMFKVSVVVSVTMVTVSVAILIVLFNVVNDYATGFKVGYVLFQIVYRSVFAAIIFTIIFAIGKPPHSAPPSNEAYRNKSNKNKNQSGGNGRRYQRLDTNADNNNNNKNNNNHNNNRGSEGNSNTSGNEGGGEKYLIHSPGVSMKGGMHGGGLRGGAGGGLGLSESVSVIGLPDAEPTDALLTKIHARHPSELIPSSH